MADPRNIAHDKKLQDEKKHHGEEVAEGAIEMPQPGKKPKLEEDTGEPDTYQQHARHLPAARPAPPGRRNEQVTGI